MATLLMSGDFKSYVQTTGIGAQDGLLCFAQLFFKKSDQLHTSKSMMNYCPNDVLCRSRELFKDFDYYNQLTMPPTGCQCCDICIQSYKCVMCEW